MAIRHIVLFTFRPEVTKEDRERALQVLERHREIPGVISVEIGAQTRPARPGKVNPDIAESLLIRSREALDAFGQDPVHKEIAQFMAGVADWPNPIDYEIDT